MTNYPARLVHILIIKDRSGERRLCLEWAVGEVYLNGQLFRGFNSLRQFREIVLYPMFEALGIRIGCEEHFVVAPRVDEEGKEIK